MVIKMKAILSILTLAFLLSMITVSASEIAIISPVSSQRCYVWDEVPIKFTSALGEGYIYTTYVNGEETDIFAPEHGGKYLIKVIAENPECDDCYIKENEIAVDVGYFPRVNKTRIVITSPQVGAEYYVNDSVPIEYKTPLTDRDGFEFTTYVTSPDGVCEPADIWTPTVPGEYGIRVNAVGDGFTFSISHGFVALAPE